MRFAPCGLNRLVAWDPVSGEKAWEVSRTIPACPAAPWPPRAGWSFKARATGVSRRSTHERRAALVERRGRHRRDGATHHLSDRRRAVRRGPGGHRRQSRQSRDRTSTTTMRDASSRSSSADRPRCPPKSPAQAVRPVAMPRPEASPEMIARGRSRLRRTLLHVPRPRTDSSGLLPDLKTCAARGPHAMGCDRARRHPRRPDGMASFADRALRRCARPIRAYVLDRAWHEPGFRRAGAVDLRREGVRPRRDGSRTNAPTAPARRSQCYQRPSKAIPGR